MQRSHLQPMVTESSNRLPKQGRETGDVHVCISAYFPWVWSLVSPLQSPVVASSAASLSVPSHARGVLYPPLSPHDRRSRLPEETAHAQDPMWWSDFCLLGASLSRQWSSVRTTGSMGVGIDRRRTWIFRNTFILVWKKRLRPPQPIIFERSFNNPSQSHASFPCTYLARSRSW